MNEGKPISLLMAAKAVSQYIEREYSDEDVWGRLFAYNWIGRHKRVHYIARGIKREGLMVLNKRTGEFELTPIGFDNLFVDLFDQIDNPKGNKKMAYVNKQHRQRKPQQQRKPKKSRKPEFVPT
ncbi:MAG: hypothetical protein ACOX0Z_03835 [Candidatus Nanosyncoccaceae bacterium]